MNTEPSEFTSPTELPAWENLTQLAQHIHQQPLAELLRDAHRPTNYCHALGGCLFDFSKQWVTHEVLHQLLELAEQTAVQARARAMFSGAIINRTEGRSVLHAALRSGAANAPGELKQAVADTLTRMYALADSIRAGKYLGYSGKPIRDVVHIGIGGSHLGPELVVQALRDHHVGPLHMHFVANIDANDLHAVLRRVNPETTLFVIVSKSFGTLETQVNALSARSWFIERSAQADAVGRHFIGVTSNIDAAQAFGLAADQLLPMWDWVGGRFSLWSAVGFPILLSLGSAGFQSFLEGARCADEHFLSAPVACNIPILSALFATWNYNFLGADSLVMLPYDERLRLLPDYLQQLEMESNGKSISLHGDPITYDTMPILWGGTGTRGQHAYHQLLHQGTRTYTADFILVREDHRRRPEHHRWLLANALAQSQAMACGQPAAQDPHRKVAGNHPNSTIILQTLSPAELGTLLAVYEHKVFCQGVIWNINSFDQWGVELGKQLAKPIYAALGAQTPGAEQAGTPGANEGVASQDAATQHLIRYLNM